MSSSSAAGDGRPGSIQDRELSAADPRQRRGSGGVGGADRTRTSSRRPGFSSTTGRPLSKAIGGHVFDTLGADRDPDQPARAAALLRDVVVVPRVNVAAVSRWLGHSSPSVTYGIYSYAMPADDNICLGRAALNAAAGVFSRAESVIPVSLPRSGVSGGRSRRSEPDDLAAVLFDMDGTLVDSERLWSVAMDRLAAELGGDRLPDDVTSRRPERQSPRASRRCWTTCASTWTPPRPRSGCWC